ncbi:MAG TPA: alanine--tRNA ligase [Verrucomicrobiae bacterium]
MTSTQIRQSFLDFFKSKQHTIVPSSSLMPDSPNLLFTNAGMNQFVPIFLGQTKCPYTPGRAADTQKCIRAGGKHNDLDDVGLDTYHHTFFEMLGNWSFGDYFKKEAIEWAWELVVEKWKFPPSRLYATVYCPHMNMARWNDELSRAISLSLIRSKGDSDFGQKMATAVVEQSSATDCSDEEAASYWVEHFLKAGLDPYRHVVPGNRKDNFWMMGETGPCGPCSELHVDLTPNGDTRGSLVNKGDARCIEIWNLVFIQFNANPDGTFSPLPAQHVDTGMGFERVTSILQCTKGFSNFGTTISNYETDIFRPIFDTLEKLSGKKYGSTLPTSSSGTGVSPVQLEKQHEHDRRDACPTTDQIALDVAFRVIADHIRTLSFAIADGIQPGNTDRNYVLRRILRRAVRYGRTLGFHEPFFYKLVDVLADTMGDVFPEIRAKKKIVQETIQREEEAFNKTLDQGIELFEKVARINSKKKSHLPSIEKKTTALWNAFNGVEKQSATLQQTKLFETDCKPIYQAGIEIYREVPARSIIIDDIERNFITACDLVRQPDISKFYELAEYFDLLQGFVLASKQWIDHSKSSLDKITDEVAFSLYDTYGFPFDLTELMARERGLTVDKDGFEKLMEEQRARARAAQKKEVISLSQIETTAPTKFVGFDRLAVEAKVLEVVSLKDKTAVVLDTSPFYAEMGGQVGDTGELTGSGQLWRVTNTQKSGNTFLHFLAGEDAPAVGGEIVLHVDQPRRNAIQRHHTVTHLLHWALHEVASKEASQKGSFVGPDKLTFDFNSAPLTPQQVADIEKLVNEKILENANVSWTEVPHADVKNRKDVMQFFGDKYGDIVRVVQIGGEANKLNGYSMELCGGTHVRATGEIGLFRIVSEAAVAAGVRRIEAVAGLTAYDLANQQLQLIKSIAGKINSPVGELEKKVEALLAHQKELEKQLKSAEQRLAANRAKELKSQIFNQTPAIIENMGEANGDQLQTYADAIKMTGFDGVIVLGGISNGAVSLVAVVTPNHIAKVQAGKIIQTIAPIVGGKGGGKPDNARGGGKDSSKLDEALAKAKSLLA